VVAIWWSSSYFRKFLEPENGTAPPSSSPLFKSQWYTMVDNDGTWALSGIDVCAFSPSTIVLTNFTFQSQNTNISKFGGVKQHEVNAFHKFLGVLYNRRYEIESAKELETIMRLADSYCALPTLSYSLDGSLHRSNGCINTIMDDPCSMLLVATTFNYYGGYAAGNIMGLSTMW
jgi:hypothetical protein